MTAKTVRFQTELARTGANTTGIVIPPELLDELGGGARPAVVVRVNGYSYRTTAGVMKGCSMLPFSAAHRDASGIAGGDTIDVELSIDREPRLADVPEDLATALAQAGADQAFRKQAPSRQRADIESILTAKAAETRSRRIRAILARL